MKLNLTAVVVNTSLVNMTVAVFSLKFSSAGKGPFMASKAKKICTRGGTSLGGRGVVEWRTWPTLTGKFRS